MYKDGATVKSDDCIMKGDIAEDIRNFKVSLINVYF
jgi:hypothetical protein